MGPHTQSVSPVGTISQMGDEVLTIAFQMGGRPPFNDLLLHRTDDLIHTPGLCGSRGVVDPVALGYENLLGITDRHTLDSGGNRCGTRSRKQDSQILKGPLSPWSQADTVRTVLQRSSVWDPCEGLPKKNALQLMYNKCLPSYKE